MQVRVKRYQDRVDTLHSQVNTVPEVEAQLKALNRDYGIVKRKHNELLNRREQAILSQQADQNSSEIKFRVIDPPRVPLQATGPNRILFSSIVLMVGFLAGAGVAFIMGLIAPTYTSGYMLTEATGLRLLGTVSLSRNDERDLKRKKQIYYFLFSVLLLLAVYLIQVGIMLK